jgi:hypothetical protein
MTERLTPGKPFGRVLYYPKEEIDELCENALDVVGCLPEEPEPIEIETFIERHFRAQVAYEDLGRGILGYTAFSTQGDVRAIGASRELFDGSKAGERRARSTLGHEAGHGLLHSRLFGGEHEYHPLFEGNYDVTTQRTMCRDRDLDNISARYSGRWWEWQANYAIGGFLLPRRLFAAAAEAFTVPSGGLNVRVLPQDSRERAARSLANTFDVNPAVARIRLSELFPDDGGQLVL